MSPQEPVFKQILGSEWNNLAPVIQRHYFTRPFSEDAICVKGIMDGVYHSWIAKLFIPIGRIIRATVPYQGKNVPIEVYYSSQPKSPCLYWKRVFHFPQKKAPFIFCSFLQPVKEHEAIEYMRFGIGLRMNIHVEEGGLVFRHQSFVWNIGGFVIPMPFSLFLGKVYIEEKPLTDKTFRMKMEIKHPLFGMMFKYSGQFFLSESA